MDRDTLIAELDDLVSELSAVQSRLLAKLARVDSERVWEWDGASSCAAWLTATFGVSYHTATSWVRTAAALTGLPETTARFAGGDLTYDQVKTLARFATTDTDVDLADTAPWMSVRQLAAMARREELVDLDNLDEAYRRRRFRHRHDEERHTIFFDGQLPDDQGAVFITALERIAKTTPHDADMGLYDGFEPRMADALYQLASQSLGADADPDRATVVVHVEASALSDGHGSGTSGDVALHAETVRRLTCDGRIQLVTENDSGRPIGVGRTTRSIPPWLARLVRDRDGGCRFPGCHHRRWVHVHHIIHWSSGGPTDLDNLITLCGYHHRLVHEKGWRISGDPDKEVTWIRADGMVYTPSSIERSLAHLAGIMKESVRGSAADDTS